MVAASVTGSSSPLSVVIEMNARQCKSGHRGLGALKEPENEEASQRYILKYSTRGGSNISSFLTQQRKRTTSWQAENDGWRVRERRQQSKKVGKMSGMVLSTKE